MSAPPPPPQSKDPGVCVGEGGASLRRRWHNAFGHPMPAWTYSKDYGRKKRWRQCSCGLKEEQVKGIMPGV